MEVTAAMAEAAQDAGAPDREPAPAADRPLDLLVVSHYFWPEELQINLVASELAARGHRVTVLTGKPNYPAGRIYPGYRALGTAAERWGGIEVLRAPVVPRGGGGRVRLALNYLSFPLSAWLSMGRLLRGRRFDAVFFYGCSPLFAGFPALRLAARGTPLLFWVQDLWPESVRLAGGIRSRAVLGPIEAFVHALYRASARVLVQSRAFRDEVEAAGVPPGRIVYFPQTASPIFRPLPPDPQGAEARLLPAGFKVMFAGNIGSAQAFDTVLAAAERLRGHPDIRWVLVGDGRRRAWVEAEVRRLGLEDRVSLPGRFPEASMPRFFAEADALLVSLEKRPIYARTIPTKVQAYLASGRPIVASLDGEGARVVEEAGAGVTAPAGDADALADAVLRLSRMPEEERREMGRRGRAYAEREFDKDRLIDLLVATLREAVAEARGARRG
jgi:glycosyltransferase involved in cell wall biosynthesis